MDVRPLDSKQDVREAIVAHTRARQAAYDDILPANLLAGMPTDPGTEAVDEWRARHPPESITLGVAADGRIRGYIHVRWAETKSFVGADEVTGLALEVFAADARARRFYEAHGFEPDGRDTVDIGGETYETVVYRCPFEG